MKKIVSVMTICSVMGLFSAVAFGEEPTPPKECPCKKKKGSPVTPPPKVLF